MIKISWKSIMKKEIRTDKMKSQKRIMYRVFNDMKGIGIEWIYHLYMSISIQRLNIYID